MDIWIISESDEITAAAAQIVAKTRGRMPVGSGDWRSVLRSNCIGDRRRSRPLFFSRRRASSSEHLLVFRKFRSAGDTKIVVVAPIWIMLTFSGRFGLARAIFSMQTAISTRSWPIGSRLKSEQTATGRLRAE